MYPGHVGVRREMAGTVLKPFAQILQFKNTVLKYFIQMKPTSKLNGY